MSSKPPTVVAALLRDLVSACEAKGIERGTLLDAADLTSQELADPDARIALRKAGALWEEADRWLDNAALQVAQFIPEEGLITDYLTAYSPTLGNGIEKLAQYISLITETVFVEIQRQRNAWSVAFGSVLSPQGIEPRFAVFSIATTLIRSRHAIGYNWRPQKVMFRFDTPSDSASYRSLFECPIEFSAPQDALVIDEDIWNRTNDTADRRLTDMIDAHAQAKLQQLDEQDPFAEALRRCVRQQLQGGCTTLTNVARQMGLSSRSLQRRLREHGTTFSEVADDVRQEVAEFLLRERKASIGEIALLLGFSDQTAFQRAFKRWTGTTPRAFRSTKRG